MRTLTRGGWLLIAVGAAAALAYSGFLLRTFPAGGGVDVTTVVSTLEAEDEPQAGTLRALDIVSAVLTLVLVPFVRRALPSSRWSAATVWSLAVFAVAGIPAGAVPLPCAEG